MVAMSGLVARLRSRPHAPPSRSRSPAQCLLLEAPDAGRRGLALDCARLRAQRARPTAIGPFQISAVLGLSELSYLTQQEIPSSEARPTGGYHEQERPNRLLDRRIEKSGGP